MLVEQKKDGGLAKSTRAQLAGRDASGGTRTVPPEDVVPADRSAESSCIATSGWPLYLPKGTGSKSLISALPADIIGPQQVRGDVLDHLQEHSLQRDAHCRPDRRLFSKRRQCSTRQQAGVGEGRLQHPLG
jgi:hypothetical protein